ncbi:hypothetical protein OE88DRAFT_1650772 [Heliocybe sulcata]|uniref:M protein, serotype 2.1 n=1 Tax=Heliocybe sulcata TaxID=5364 RepID=A0A5C3NTU0_9AGAM|nr:hypothetical protein OE88DRAFT_1650772 [Heliocybe sulcata]
MATVASPPPGPGARRTPPGSSRPTHTPSSSISKGATARSAVSSRSNTVMSPGRRASLRAAAPPRLNGVETKESLADSLRRETDEKEQLMVQLQNKEQVNTNLTAENDNLSSALNSAESRLTELYADQARMEEEMAARMDIVDKLRNQVRELEKEKRDVQRRYNEQTSTFEAERQAFYDNEQHLKSRIASLTQTRKQAPSPHAHEPSETDSIAPEEEVENAETDALTSSPEQPQDMDDPETEPAEMTALKLELSTLSTSYSSMQSTLVLLQSQLVDLKRVNRELQEENESYNILLTEKTLNGQFDLLKQVAAAAASSSSDDEDETADMSESGDSSLGSMERRRLEIVEEAAEEDAQDVHSTLEAELERSLEPEPEPASPTQPRRRGRGRGASMSSKSLSPGPHGESLADLPITGPGLDLAAELGRAENKDILEGRAVDERDRSTVNPKSPKKSKKGNADASRKVSTAADAEAVPTDMETLRNEVKSLKDANKALSLYASKIIDRIIAQEGFEHVLAVDYEKVPPTPNPKSPGFTTFDNLPPKPKQRPQSAIFGFGASSTPQQQPSPSSPTPTATTPPQDAMNKPMTKNRRSLSFDWRSFAMFGGDKKAEVPTLKPLTLRAGSVTGARKLDTQEDEEDRRERERMIATMKLMGIEKPAVTSPPMIQKSISSPAPQSVNSPSPSQNSSTSGSRFSFFRTRSTPSSETSSFDSPSVQLGQPPLTQEALEQAEAENKLAALDAHERTLSAEIAKGATGGYTEITRTRRSRRSQAGSSGSTVWSAGMSKNGEDGDE